jgi:hypothetical protein
VPTRTARFLLCPGSSSSVHREQIFVEIMMSERGYLFARCPFCNCRLFLNGPGWYGEADTPGDPPPGPAGWTRAQIRNRNPLAIIV